ncbi:aromatase [Platysternon megacephalum]|uniref:Aromatase n=1 Tax=Platysternon megacephalum TaxID=55544 RepID=A0A4D9E9E2_9SAUR|nr:aromatase [Platysternon megacephalum]
MSANALKMISPGLPVTIGCQTNVTCVLAPTLFIVNVLGKIIYTIVNVNASFFCYTAEYIITKTGDVYAIRVKHLLFREEYTIPYKYNYCFTYLEFLKLLCC